jgi:hypothetical protein
VANAVYQIYSVWLSGWSDPDAEELKPNHQPLLLQ